MDYRLLSYYNRELQYLRELGGEFARQFPKVAGRLGLEAFECSDPYVERLLEGFAFLAARVQLKIDAEFPRFTEHLLSLAYPHFLAPTPSMAVVKFQPSDRLSALVDGYRVDRGAILHSANGRGELTQCDFRTAHDVTLWPIELVSVSHTAYTGDLGEYSLRGKRPIRGALRFRLRSIAGTPFNRLAIEDLALFLSGPEQISMRMYELLFAGTLALMVKAPGAGPQALVVDEPIRPIGFEDDEALLPFGAKSFQGYRLLHEYFALPSRFQFVELRGLRPGIAQCEGSEIEIVVLLDRHEPAIEAAVTPAHFELFATPVVNLFPKRLDRIHLSDRVHQYHIVADRTRPLNYEVHSVTEVLGVGTRADVRREFLPFYACQDRNPQQASFYTIHREPRIATTREQRNGPRSSYPGSEAFIALVDAAQGPLRTDLKQLALSALCTNRDLPLTMSLGVGRSDFVLDSGGPISSINCISGPSEPRPATAWGATSWQLISHLSLNYLSITDGDEIQGAAGLRQLLHLYGDFASPAVVRQIEGVRSVASSRIVRRMPGPGPQAFGRGVEIAVECDEAAFEGGSAFLFAAILERFFAKQASLNSFCETVLRSVQRGELMRWPARIGRRAVA